VSNQPLVALIVVAPILVAVLLNLGYGKIRFSKYLFIASAFALLIIVLLSGYGYHWFAGHPIFQGLRLSLEYVFTPYHKFALFILSLLLIFTAFAASVSVVGKPGVYYAFLLLCYASTAMAVLTNDLYHLWIAVEVASLIIAGVVIAAGSPGAHRATLKYMFITGFAGAGLAVSLAILLGVTGVANISDAVYALSTMSLEGFMPTIYMAYAFFVIAWIYVAGMAPTHPIKADIYRYSLPHAAALLQAQAKLMMVAIGLIILRLFGSMPFTRESMLVISLITAIFGVVLALMQSDLRHVLAYIVVSHGGLVGIGLSIGTAYAISAALFQAINDIIYMGLLFLACEAIILLVKRDPAAGLGNLISKAPSLALFIFIGSFAASGIPPLNGFQSELMLINAALSVGLPEVAVVILFVSVTTFIALFKSIYEIILRPKKVESEVLGSIPNSLYASLFILSVLCIVFGLIPQLPLSFINPMAAEVGLAWPH